MRKIFLTGAILILFYTAPATVFAATHYVDNTLGGNCAGGAGTSYRVANQDCGGSDGTKAWTTLLTALTGSRVTLGDTVYMRAGTYTENQINTAFAAGSGSVTVENYNSEVVTIQTGTITNGSMFITQNLTFKGINWDNNNVATGSGHYLFGVYSTSAAVSFTFEDGSIEGDSSTNDLRVVQPYGDQAHVITINRATVFSASSVIYNVGSGSSATVVNIYSSLLHDNSLIHFQSGAQATALTLKNNTITRFASYAVSMVKTGSTITATNNIFDVKGTGFSANVWNLGDPYDSEVITDNSKFDVTYNYYYSRESPIGINTWGNIITSSNVVPYIPASNWFVDPGFTSYNSDYTLSATSEIAQRGTNDHPPDGTDINGTTFGTNDVGAYVNPSIVTLTALSSTKIGWHGDSIMNGSGASANSSPYDIFSNQVSGNTVTDYSVGGLFSRGLFWTVDQSLWTGDKTLILSIGVNDITSPRTSQTNAQVDNMIEITLSKITNFGATPVWMGISSISGSPPDNSDVTAINDEVVSYANTQGITNGSILTQMQNNADWQTDYYSDLSSNVHPNDSGYAVIGNLAEYLFNTTKYTVGTDDVGTSGDIRIYSDGKYRYTSATTSNSTANLSITPLGGSFDSDDSSTWLEVSSITWNTSGTYAKDWTASSTVATTTIFNIGDLIANAYYTVSVDDVATSTAQADSTGLLSYTYTGGWSSHTFNIDATPATCSISLDSSLIYNGQSAALTWTSTNGLSASINNSIGSVGLNSNTTVSPAIGAYTYTLTVTGGGSGAGTTCSTPLTVKAHSSPQIWGSSPTAPGYKVDHKEVNEEANNTYADTVVYKRDLTIGNTGDDVTLLQRFLIANGHSILAGATGYFGNQTRVALVSYQKENKIAPAIGYFGPITRANVIENKLPTSENQKKAENSNDILQFTRDLSLNDTGNDVQQLQIYLNINGYILSSSGPGSPGKETERFGALTKRALTNFQNTNANEILKPVGLKQGTGYFGESTRAYINSHL